MPYVISCREQQALEHLIRVATGFTGQSRMAAEFLLAWWNAESCDLAAAWGVDADIAADMVRVFALAVACHQYPDSLGYESSSPPSSTLGGPH